MTRRSIGNGIELDDDRSRVDVDVVFSFLSEEAYWVKGRSRETIERLIRESTRVVAAYDGQTLVGFCRVVTDGASVAWLGDVFVVASHRRGGIATELIREAVEDPHVRDLQWYLGTRDAHDLYRRFGFREPDDGRTMVRPRRAAEGSDGRA